MNIRKINRIIKAAKPDIDLTGQKATTFYISSKIQLKVFYIPNVADPKMVCLRGLDALLYNFSACDALIEKNFASLSPQKNDAEREAYFFTSQQRPSADTLFSCALYSGMNWIEIPLGYISRDAALAIARKRKRW
jgi:hypothetical protein